MGKGREIKEGKKWERVWAERKRTGKREESGSWQKEERMKGLGGVRAGKGRGFSRWEGGLVGISVF